MDVRRFRMLRLIAEGARLLGPLIRRRDLSAILDVRLPATIIRDPRSGRARGRRGTRRRGAARWNVSAADAWRLTVALRIAALLAALLRERANGHRNDQNEAEKTGTSHHGASGIELETFGLAEISGARPVPRFDFLTVSASPLQPFDKRLWNFVPNDHHAQHAVLAQKLHASCPSQLHGGIASPGLGHA
jgi:hypothetical protein